MRRKVGGALGNELLDDATELVGELKQLWKLTGEWLGDDRGSDDMLGKFCVEMLNDWTFGETRLCLKEWLAVGNPS